MMKLSKSVLDKIKKNKILPRPRWHFVALHILLWSLAVAAIVFGSIAFSVIFGIIGGVEWEIVRRVGKGPIHSFVLILPYIWIALLGAVLFLASRLFEKTKKGYRHKHILVVGTSIVISLAIGATLHAVGMGRFIEDNLNNKIGPYAEWTRHRERIMVAPDDGTLVGEIVELKSDEEIMILDFIGKKWAVDIDGVEFKDDFEPEVGVSVGVIGEKIKEGEFKADRIMLWKQGSHKRLRMMVPDSSENETLSYEELI